MTTLEDARMPRLRDKQIAAELEAKRLAELQVKKKHKGRSK